MSTTLINGRVGELICSAERGLHYGDGLFETVSCREGRPRWLPLHLQRLRQGCERLRLPFRDYEALGDEIGRLAAEDSRCMVKAIVTRGCATRRGYGPSGEEQPTRIVERCPWPEQGDGTALQLGISSVRLGTNPRLAGLKHLNRLEQVLAQLERDADLDEVLMLSSTGCVIGGSMSNAFFADEAGLFTPALEQCGVAGVMRRLVLEAAQGLGVPLSIRCVLPAELATVREIFVTNVRWGIRSVARLGGRQLPSDEYAQRLRRLIDGAQS